MCGIPSYTCPQCGTSFWLVTKSCPGCNTVVGQAKVDILQSVQENIETLLKEDGKNENA